jgi:hypothetical protein
MNPYAKNVSLSIHASFLSLTFHCPVAISCNTMFNTKNSMFGEHIAFAYGVWNSEQKMFPIPALIEWLYIIKCLQRRTNQIFKNNSS